MKRFVFITIIFFGIFSNCNIAKAQYATSTQQAVSIFDNPQYKHAQQKVKKGKTLFFTGLGLQALGAINMAISPVIDEAGYVYGPNGPEYHRAEYSDASTFCMVFGVASAITGTVLETIGGIKWLSGSSTIKDLRFEYAVRGNGIVITF
jgi:hypothetical protein